MKENQRKSTMMEAGKRKEETGSDLENSISCFYLWMMKKCGRVLCFEILEFVVKKKDVS